MSKKETRRAARGAYPKAPVPTRSSSRVRNYNQKPNRTARPARSPRTAPALRPPTLKRAAIQGAILAVLYLIVIRFFWKQPDTGTLTYIIMPAAGFVIYTAVAYGIDKLTYNRRLRKLKGTSR